MTTRKRRARRAHRDLLSITMSAPAHPHLHDFDWSLYHVTDSSSLDRVHAPLLQLHLRIAKPDGAVKTEIVELKPAELDAVLGQLAASGYPAVALDLRGHGESPLGNQAGWSDRAYSRTAPCPERSDPYH